MQCYGLWNNFFYQPVKIDLRTYDNIWNIATGQDDDYTAGCLIDYLYFQKYYKLIAVGFDPKTRCWSKSNTKN